MAVPVLLLWLAGAVGVLPLLGPHHRCSFPAGPLPGGQHGARSSTGSRARPAPACLRGGVRLAVLCPPVGVCHCMSQRPQDMGCCLPASLHADERQRYRLSVLEEQK